MALANENSPVFVAPALVFGLLHAIDWRLVLATFLLELVIVPLYLRHRNLWPLGLLHGWLGGLFYLWVLKANRARMFYDAMDVQECAPPTGTRDVNPGDFALQMSDNTRYTSTLAIKEPGFHATTLGPNRCLRGWVTFEIPQGQTPALILLTSSTDIMWKP